MMLQLRTLATAQVQHVQQSRVAFDSIIPFVDKQNLWWKMAPSALVMSNGQSIGIIQLPHFLNPSPIRKDFIHEALKYEQSWMLQQTNTAKTLSMVRGSSRKPHPQKGTGRARQGNLRAPQLAKGYKPHSQVACDRTLNIIQNVYDRAVIHALATKFKQSQFVVVDELTTESINKLGLKNVLGLYGRQCANGHTSNGSIGSDIRSGDIRESALPECEEDNDKMFVNIRHISVTAVLEYEYLVIDKEALEVLGEMYAKYNPAL